MFGDFVWTQAQYGKKMRWTAEQFAAHPVELFCLQELWNARCLQEVLVEAGLSHYQSICFSDENVVKDGRDMHVAAAVHPNCEIISHEWLHAFPADMRWKSTDPRYEVALHITHFSRPVLKLRLRMETGGTLCVFIVHLKSRLPIAPQQNDTLYYGVGADHWLDIGRALAATRRAAEAAVLRVLINGQLAQGTDTVIVAGDFNERYPGTVLDIIKGDARFRRQGTNRSGRRANWGLYHLLQLADYEKNLARPHSEYITFCGDDELFALDHLLFSSQFHPRAAGSSWRLQSFDVVSQHLGHDKPHLSDHALVKAIFSFAHLKHTHQ